METSPVPARYRHAASVPGKLVRIAFGLIAKANELQQLGDPRIAFISCPSGHPQRVSNVSRHRTRPKQIELLKDHADIATQAPEFTLAQRTHFRAVHDDAAGGGRSKPLMRRTSVLLPAPE